VEEEEVEVEEEEEEEAARMSEQSQTVDKLPELSEHGG
jgi:hypothetical protein